MARLVVGLGGTTVEVVGDVAVRMTPLSNIDADEMPRSLRSYRLLTGHRQTPTLHVAAFAGLACLGNASNSCCGLCRHHVPRRFPRNRFPRKGVRHLAGRWRTQEAGGGGCAPERR